MFSPDHFKIQSLQSMQFTISNLQAPSEATSQEKTKVIWEWQIMIIIHFWEVHLWPKKQSRTFLPWWIFKAKRQKYLYTNFSKGIFVLLCEAKFRPCYALVQGFLIPFFHFPIYHFQSCMIQRWFRRTEHILIFISKCPESFQEFDWFSIDSGALSTSTKWLHHRQPRELEVSLTNSLTITLPSETDQL